MTSRTPPRTSAPAPLVAAAETPPLAVTHDAKGRFYVEMGYLFAAVGAALFSTKAIVIKLAYDGGVDAETLLAYRMALSLPIYAVVAALALSDRQKRGAALPTRKVVVKAMAIGALGYWIASYTDFLGLKYISASFERLILFTYPFFVVVLGALFFKQAINARVLAAICISYVGLAVIFAEKTDVGDVASITIGAGFVLVAAVTFALYQLLAKGPIAEIGPRLFTCIAMTGASICVFIQFLVTHPLGDLVIGRDMVLLSVVLAVGSTVLPSFFLNAALHRISAQANGAIGTLSPVVTILLAVAVLGEQPTPTDMLGTAMVLAGVGWFTLAGRKG